MKMKNWKLSYYFIIAVAVILLDQLVKYLIHTNMYEGESINIIGNWLKLNYQTNEGMAWGQKLDFLGKYAKITLTSFRIVVACLIPWYLHKLYTNNSHRGLILCGAFILAGAVGNLVDSLIYGVLDEELLIRSYEPLFKPLHGMVIDMFYFDIYHGYDLPILGELHLWPVFNVADASIFCSVIAILIFNKRFFPEENETKENVTEQDSL
jgi:signal peptidase II